MRTEGFGRGIYSGCIENGIDPAWYINFYLEFRTARGAISRESDLDGDPVIEGIRKEAGSAGDEYTLSYISGGCLPLLRYYLKNSPQKTSKGCYI
jgi:hypothetical protein